MAYRFDQSKVGGKQELSDSYLQRDQSTSWWADGPDCKDQADSLREQLRVTDEHVARLQADLRSERLKSSRLQLQCSQQEAELKRREMLSSRLKERLTQLTDRHKGPSIDVLNVPPGSRGKREQLGKSVRFTASRREEAALRLMLERREAELREAMKLRHSLTTLLHALRVDMEQWLPEFLDITQDGEKKLDETEAALGEHLTGGVVQSWRLVQKKLQSILSEGQTAAGTDHDKLMAQLEIELKESQEVVRLQQQLLQDSLASTVPSELSDSYFLEEWERLQMSWAELTRQRRTFERERQAFTDAAIRLSHERRDFEQQRGLFLKQQYLCDSPLFHKEAANRRDSSAFNFSGVGGANLSGCFPISPSPSDSGDVAAPEGRVRVQTPSTPQLYSALNLPYDKQFRETDHRSETWEGGVDRRPHTTWPSFLNWS
ncbi:PREDICTED: afadin- and alpha-actinin-binding protein-like isoform X1 [Poecilia mexicana]|uniref:afadin- and alpha-actinin-binding protein-like isoform X1 n=1 Tax=Poecilia mexicana TaxID=48701 RepID=UPI00072E9DAC|nr:PREDICTED: afadin- and alpha-actinin-binding protein-like isoform X1 [Poecilia mexicana]